MHLEIKQSVSNTEQVSADLIDKLYNLSRSGTLDNTSSLQGRIEAAAAYEDAVAYLNTMWGPNLIVTASAYYIRFADEEVVRVFTEKGILSEGEGLTVSQADELPNGGGGTNSDFFKDNLTIRTFDEIKYFGRIMRGNFQIGGWFNGATNLESVNLTGMTGLSGYSAFKNCKNLEWFHGKNNLPKNTLNLENLNGTYGNSIFAGCEKLYYIESLGNLMSIGDSMFQSCVNLETVNLPYGLTTINNNAFNGCSDLTTIDISNITTINANVFEGDGNLEYFSGADSTAGELYLPNLTGTLGNTAFKGCAKLISVVSLGSITSIGNNAFENCVNLATINIPSTVTSVGTNAFNNTAWYNNQPNGPIYTSKVLYKCKNTSGTLVIPNDIVSITQNAFNNCSGLTSVTIGSGVTSIGIGEGVFKDCTALSTITVDSNNAKYDSRNNCNAIIETDTNKLVAICNTATIPNSITAIGNRAFSGCSRFDISALSALNLTLIGDRAFADCGCIGTFTVPLGVTLSNNAFGYIKDSAGSKATIILSEGYSATIYGMFAYSRLQKVELPSTITTIAENTFYVASINEVVIKASTPPTLRQNAFTASSITNIYVPAASVDTYKTTSGWSSFASRIQAIPTT